MTEATRLIISEACAREGIKLYADTVFYNISPGVYQFTHFEAWKPPIRKVAVIKGFDVVIYDY